MSWTLDDIVRELGTFEWKKKNGNIFEIVVQK